MFRDIFNILIIIIIINKEKKTKAGAEEKHKKEKGYLCMHYNNTMITKVHPITRKERKKKGMHNKTVMIRVH